MNYFIAVVVALLSGTATVLFKDKLCCKDKAKLNIKETFGKNKYFALATYLVFIGIAIGAVYMFSQTKYGYAVMYRWLVLIFGLYLISIIDYKVRIIPNVCIAVLSVIRLCFLIYEAIIAFDTLKLVFISPLIGMVVGGAIILVSMLISRKSIGMGDVKLFALIGFYVGSKSIIPSLFCTILFSAIFGAGLLIFRKAKIKDTMPMAPFAAAGVLVNFILTFIGGK